MAPKLSSLLVCWLTTSFVILQLVAPPGMMPRAGADGFEVVICPSLSLHQMLVETFVGNEEQTSAQSDEFCVFSVISRKSPAAVLLGSLSYVAARPRHVFTLNKVAHYENAKRSHTPRAPPIYL
ncbi:hypothetical protein GCM10007094_37170 [Pseudovibrio japonicus]|uniref:Secreted protein n=1 Tax=Pseudovibrio japonicus TaxID=366534 RepID=A0ABQ3EKX4_9HYPH|nr:hypothetical protein [Pseudovibrio japonicus]GHB44414.1 hypothetical protein GCM10007094_37170 [Pseudovibrio japonicus]